jgi:hypothetical protein
VTVVGEIVVLNPKNLSQPDSELRYIASDRADQAGWKLGDYIGRRDINIDDCTHNFHVWAAVESVDHVGVNTSA